MPPSSATARWKPISRNVDAASVEMRPNSQHARMRCVGSGRSSIDAQLELAARQQPRAGDVARLVGIALAHVEHDQVVAAASTRAFSSASDMNGTVAAASRQQLRDRLAAAHVGAQRLGHVGRHRQVEAAHHLDEGGALALLQARVRRRAPAPIVEWPRPL